MASLYKRVAKRAIQHLAARLGPHTQSAGRPRLLILMYHRILPERDPRAQDEEPGMMVTPETFAMHLRLIPRHFEVMHLSEWLRRRREGRPLPPRACAMTFDDGWADNFEFAYPLLEAAQIPASIFLVSHMMGTTATFWPERLAALVRSVCFTMPGSFAHPQFDWLRSAETGFAFSHTPPSPEERYELIAHAKALDDREIHERIDSLYDALDLPPEKAAPALLDWGQVREMCEGGLIEMGSHTCHHIRLNSRVSPHKMEHEIMDSKREIETRLQRPVELFCYPNGDYTPPALELVRRHYLGAVITAGGWNTNDTDRVLMRRIAVHQDIARDEIAFTARLSGWL